MERRDIGARRLFRSSGVGLIMGFLTILLCAWGNEEMGAGRMDTTRWVTHCFGRFLIDLPPGTQVRAGYRVWGDPIERLSWQASQAHERIGAREHELKNSPHESHGALLVRREEHGGGSASLVFWAAPFSTSAMLGETYLLAEDKVYVYSGTIAPEKVESALGFSGELSRRLRTRAVPQLPSEPGFCIEGGYISGNEFMGESFRAGITVPGHPGLQLTFRSATGAAENGLLERVGGFFRTEVLGAAVGMNTLRKGQRSVGRLAGEEYLVAGGEQQQRVYAFRWEFQGRDGSLAEPNLALEMGVMERDPDAEGNPPAPAFSTDAEALQLWDAMLESIRLRPGAV